MSNPTVSVIISTYNRPKELERAIKSVVNQSYTDWELIVVDDHSNKKSNGIVSPGIRYLRLDKNSGGPAKPRNEGIKMAKGKYLAFLDDDNEYRPDHLNVLVNAIEKHQVDIVYGDRWVITPDGKGQVGLLSDFQPQALLQRNYIDTSDFLITREAMQYLGGWDEGHKRFLDWQLMVRAAKAMFTFKRVPLIITNYYLHNKMLSAQAEVDNDPTKPAWSPKDCVIRLPYLGPVPEPKVAIFSLTYDRLDYTKKCFASMCKTAGYQFDHVVVDNGSTDGTREWLDWNSGESEIYLAHNSTFNFPLNSIRHIQNEENKGISIASNQALDMIGNNYDIIVKVDNDCLFLTEGWLATMVKIWKSNHHFALSTYIQGLRDNPGGAPREVWGEVCDEMLGMTQHLGGICCFVDARAYKDFRWDESSTLHGVQDLEFSRHLTRSGYQMAYLENYFAEHYEGTAGQEKRYPAYFERRKLEKQTRPTRTYEEIQESESAFSRGTKWGERVKDTIDRYLPYIKGKVLDVGANDGLGVEYLKSKGFVVSGVDAAKSKVEAAQDLELPVVHGYMEKLPFGDKQFDTIFCSHTLEHAQDIHQAVKEFARVGNRLLLVVPIEETTVNAGHTSPIPSKEYVKDLFSSYTVVHEEELERMEKEYVLILDF